MKIAEAKISAVNMKAPAVHAQAMSKLMSTGHVMGSAPKLSMIASPKVVPIKIANTPVIRTFK